MMRESHLLATTAEPPSALNVTRGCGKAVWWLSLDPCSHQSLCPQTTKSFRSLDCTPSSWLGVSILLVPALYMVLTGTQIRCQRCKAHFFHGLVGHDFSHAVHWTC